MLKKLLKHELKATSRYITPIFLILFLFTILNKIILGLDIFKGMFKGALKIIPGIAITGYVLSLIAIVVVTFVILVVRFYKNLTSEEGYLMFTLPVKSNQLVNSKLLIAMFWTVLSILAVILSL
ncbi:MAG TPA: ABC transporter permease, partial [Lachnospiraceae bacterium]|nr:ABC transporter permease [Lachnospiraceae bacterium]